MTYQEAVTEAATALKRGEDANWELARLTYENTLERGEQGAVTGKVPMERWCADVRDTSGRRFSTHTGLTYRRIWAEKGTDYLQSTEDDRLSWGEARWSPEVTNLDRQSELDRVNVHHITHLASPETQAKVVEQLLDNPTIADRVAERVLSNPETVARVMRTESPASQAITAAVDTSRALAEVDRVLDGDDEPGDEPRASYGDFQARTRDIIKHDPSSQHDRVMEVLNGHMTEHPATDLAEALSSSQHTARVDVYETQAQMAIAWFQELLDGLRAASKPRLVAVK